MVVRLSLPLLLGLLALLPGRAATLGPNRVLNSGFEADEPTQCWAWGSADAAKVTCRADDKVAHSGRRSVRLHSELAFAPNVFGGISQRVGGLSPGAEYVVSLWAKGQRAGICWFGGGPQWLSRAQLPRGDFDWTRLELRWRAPDQPTDYELRVNVDSETEALWIDDLAVQEVDPIGPVPRVRSLTAAQAARQGYLLLTPMSAAPRIDGDLSDWPADVPTTRLPQDAGLVALDRRDDDDFSAALRVAYGQDALYLAVAVRDDVQSAPPDAMAWTNDGIQIAFDPRHERTPGGYGPHDSEYSLMLGDDGKARVQCWQPADGLGDRSADITLAARRVGKVTSYEAAIPWRAIGVTVGAGGPLLGLNALINDNDGAGRRGYVELTAGIGRTKDPSAYVTALSRGANSLAVMPGKPVTYTGEPVDLAAVLVLGKPLAAAATLELAALDSAGRATPLGVASLPAGQANLVRAECRLPSSSLPADTRQVRARAISAGAALATGTAPLRISDLRARLAQQAERLRARTAEAARLAEQAEARHIATDYERVAITCAQDFVDFALADIDNDRVPRAEHVLAVLDRSLTEAAASLSDYLAGRRKPLLVPRYVTGRVEQRDGAFYGDTLVPSTGARQRRPVFFVGYGHFGRVVDDLPKFTGYGTNIIQIECGPNSTQPSEGVLTEEPVRERIGRALKLGEQHNQMVVFLASPHYFPDWALAKWPDLRRGGGGFFGVTVDAPQARTIFRRHLEASMKAIGNSPALHSVCLSNEPTYTNWAADPYRRAELTDWLAARFGSVERLNAALGTTASSFATVPIGATDSLPSENQMTPLRYELARFNMDMFSGYHRAMSDVVHAARPGTWTHAKVMCVPASRQQLAWGCDPEQFAQMGDLNGNDCYCMYRGLGDQYAATWLPQNLYYDIQYSMRRVPVTNTEDHIIVDREQKLIPPEHTDYALWQGALHGRGASCIWVWERTYDRTHDFEGSILHRPENTMAVGRAALDLQRLAPEMVRLQQAPAPVAILYSMTAQLWSDSAAGSLMTAYEALNACGVPVRLVSERQAAEGGLKAYRAVVAPQLRHVPDSLVAAVADYCRGGGQLWSVGDEPPFGRDEHNRPRAVVLPAEAVRQFSSRFSPRQLSARFLSQIRDAGWQGPVTLARQDGQAPWAVEYRAVADGDGALLAVVNLWGLPQTVRVSVARRPAQQIDDLRRGTRLPAGDLLLKPLEARLLRVR